MNFICICIFQLTDLREELECRNLSSKGLKSQLIARLMKALRSEEEKETEEIENKCLEEVWPALYFYRFILLTLVWYQLLVCISW